jgi:hypothetical protein
MTPDKRPGTRPTGLAAAWVNTSWDMYCSSLPNLVLTDNILVALQRRNNSAKGVGRALHSIRHYDSWPTLLALAI